MDKTVTWQDKSPESSSESPTLSNRPAPFKRKPSIFSKLRKSLLGTITSIGSSSSNNNDDDGGTGRVCELKRSLSMDAGLQDRITQLAITTPLPTDPINEQELQRTLSKSRLRRSKSLMNPIDLKMASPSGMGSNLHSPATDESESLLMEECESLNTPQAASLINTIETRHLHSSHQVFECSWLAPTRKFQLFPGHLTLQPRTSSILFNCRHLTRSIRLKFHFDDVLNISRGSWNDKRNQALIIDLVRGKRKSWVFVAWTEDQFESAVDSLVKAWRLHCLNKIKGRIDRRRSHLNMKYCRIIREADRAATEFNFSEGILEKLKRFFCDSGHFGIRSENNNESIYKKLPTLSIQPEPAIELENLLFSREISSIIPDVLASILVERSTSFMTNFRELQGLEISNDSGWDDKNSQTPRTFLSTIKDDDGRITFKWNVSQKFILESPELVIFQASLVQNSFEENQKVVYEIASIRDETIDGEASCLIRISSDIQSERIRSYFKNVYFPSLFQLLEAFIYESACEFSGQEAESSDQILLPPHYRFMKEFFRNGGLEMNLYFTTAVLPFLYKFIHFKEFKLARYSFASTILLISFRLGLFFLLDWFKGRTTTGTLVDVEEQFSSLLRDLSADAIEGTAEIQSLKLKYNI